MWLQILVGHIADRLHAGGETAHSPRTSFSTAFQRSKSDLDDPPSIYHHIVQKLFLTITLSINSWRQKRLSKIVAVARLVGVDDNRRGDAVTTLKSSISSPARARHRCRMQNVRLEIVGMKQTGKCSHNSVVYLSFYQRLIIIFRERDGTHRSVSSTIVSYNPRNPIAPSPKKSRRSKPATLSFPPGERPILSSDTCDICLEVRICSSEKLRDDWMLKCAIDSCSRGYHLSCLRFESDKKQVFQVLDTGTRISIFFRQECFNPRRKDLVEAVSQAESSFKIATDMIQQAFAAEKEE